MFGRRKYRLSLRLHIASAMIVLLLASGGALVGLTYFQALSSSKTEALDQFQRLGGIVEEAIDALYRPAIVAVEFIGQHPIVEAENLGERLQYAPFIATILKNSEDVSSIYIGYPDGDFFMIRPIPDQQTRAALGAPPGSAYVAQSIDREPDGSETGIFVYLTSSLLTLRSTSQPSYVTYDPRVRPWYDAAREIDGPVRTAPYVFFTTQEVGTTVAGEAPVEGVVIGADLTLTTLSGFLESQLPTPDSVAAVVDPEGLVIAHPDPTMVATTASTRGGPPRLAVNSIMGPNTPLLARVAIRDASDGLPSGYLQDLDGYFGFAHALTDAGLEDYRLLLVTPEADLVREANALAARSFFVSMILLMAFIPVATWIARQISEPLARLKEETDRFTELDFDHDIDVVSTVAEVTDLSQSVDRARSMVRRAAEITETVSRLEDFDALLSYLLKETAEIVDGKHGVLYLSNAAETEIEPASVHGRAAAPLGNLPLDDMPMLVLKALTSGSTTQVPGTPATLKFSGADPNDPHMATGATVLLVPLRTRERELIGLMVLARKGDATDQTLRFLDRMSGSTVVAIETRKLIRAQKELFDSFIKMIAGAIDAKSPYTGGHCERVPELTQMIAQAAHQVEEGPFAAFQLTAGEWEALHLAAWLHDCGKVTTPDFVVDKATKLETIYDRLHEVRMRFEVLKRDAEIEFFQARLNGMEEEAARATRDAMLKTLDEEFAFVAESNLGGEFMDREAQDRLEQIAQRTWRRTLDDRIGLSHEELGRKGIEPVQALPVMENLLADKPEHIIIRRDQDRMTPDNRWGFKIPQPDNLYNRGELHNLAIPRGTLTAEERYKINEHIVQTIKMLDQLPFPKHLRHVPELAGGHHEKMDGTGYPRGLLGDEMSPVARIMAVADIFEALTAVDRPYKKGKTLSQALKIMGFMVKDRHIDAEIFDLFLTQGVWKDYADRYMRADQIDEVDIEALRPALPAAAAE